MVVKLVIVILLLILSAFFSSAETALTTVSQIKLRSLAERGSKSAAKVIKCTENKSKLLSTILIGNNIVNLTASALTTTLCTEAFGNKYLGFATGILTFLVLVFGEIIPKTMASCHSVGMSKVFVYPISVLMVILTPFIFLLDIITGLIFKLLRIPQGYNEDVITESELRTIVDVSHEEGVIEPEERFMISNVVDFGDALSKDIMIPRADVVCADVNSTYDEMVELFIKETFSRIPIYEESRDNIIGILYMKDLFFFSEKKGAEQFNMKRLMRKPLFVYEYQRTAQIFSDMKTSSVSMAVVLDEYGVTTGIITMEDLIEEIVGEIRDEYDADEEKYIIRVDDDTYDIDASIRLDDLNDALSTSLSSDNYDSLAGFVIERMDKLPGEGEETDYENLHFRVMKVAKNRIERVLVKIEKTEQEEAAE